MSAKENFRKAQKIALARVPRGFRRNYAVFKNVQKIIAHQGAKNVLLYTAKPYEIDILRYRKKFAKKCKIFVPFMQEKNLKMVKLRLPFSKRRFGIYEPNDSRVCAKIDLAIVPVLGVDGDFRRLGHGFGFYDRFFQNLNYKPKICFISAIKGFCKEKFTQKHDVQGDCYINPYEFIYRKNNDRTHRVCRNRPFSRRWSRFYSR